MGSGMFLIQGDELIEMNQQPYELESDLQKWLAKWPGLIPGDQIDSVRPRRFTLITREFGIAGRQDGADRWFLDHLFVDQDAVPTLVEVKRSSDSRSRREVVAQMLDYAANGVAYSSVDRLRELYNARCRAEELDPDSEVLALVDDGRDVEWFWESVQKNLGAGNIRMIFVSDFITPELLRIVEFLNTQMKPAEVLAVEIRQFVGQDLKTLVPRVMGITEEAKSKKSASRPGLYSWDEASYFEGLSESSVPGISDAARRILDWANERQLSVDWGQGKSACMYVRVHGRQVCMLDVTGRWWLSVGEIAKLDPYQDPVERQALLECLRSAATITPNAVSQPSIDPRFVADPGVRTTVLQILGKVVDRVRDAAPA